jgi:uracil-DNA glycosylase family 4
MFVGEQPEDQEDRAGHPFVGPAGRLLNHALEQAGIDPAKVYLTNVMKHFKWAAAARGKKRIHKKPRDSEIHACRAWLDAELRLVKPQILVCLGFDSRTVFVRPRLQGDASARAMDPFLARSLGDGNRTSIVHSASARRRRSSPAKAGIH